MSWNLSKMPSLAGKTAIVTGGNKGLGFETVKQLATAGAKVILACRTKSHAQQAIANLPGTVRENLSIICIDLTDLDSVRAFADAFKSRYERLDILVNNAGVVNLEHRQVTAHNVEMHFATNHLGHFALTGHLLELLKNSPEGRIVTVTSGGYKFGEIRFDDINWEKRPYHRVKSYGDSKLANYLFSWQLQQLLLKHELTNLTSVSAHPGLAATERQQTIGVGGLLSKWLAAPVEKGSLPQIQAAVDKRLSGGEMLYPRFGIFGSPVVANITLTAEQQETAEKLWEYSEQATGVSFNLS